MSVNTTLTDSEGFIWDIQSDAAGSAELGIVNGTNDAFDGGMRLFVDGVSVNPQSASVDGRELNTAPVLLINGIAVSRSILISDAAISQTGFARFLDSFTNTTDAVITITVETLTNSGADTALQVTGDSSGDGFLTTADTGLVTDDSFTTAADPAVMQAFGDGTLLPTGLTVGNSLISVTHTLTLQPGETQSLLQFATQNAASSDGVLDLQVFTDSAAGLDAAGLLEGLTREERLSIVNYAGFDTLTPTHTITDSDGNRWGIDDQGRLSTLDSDTLQNFSIPLFLDRAGTPVSVTEDAAGGEVTIVTRGTGGLQAITVTSTYTALPAQGVIRLVVTATNSSPLEPLVFSPLTAEAAGPTGTQVVLTGVSPDFGIPSGVVLDDSESGTGGTQPALTYAFGATGPGDTFTLDGQTLIASMPDQILGAGATLSYLFFFALNDTGLAALTDLTRLNNPGPELLTGLSAAEVAGIDNFDLDETDRLQEVLGANDVDDVIVGHSWGDKIVTGTGDDTIFAGGSDDVAHGGEGDDSIDGGDGDDLLTGGDDQDEVIGGAGNDNLDGGNGNDLLIGQTGDDTIAGAAGKDSLLGNNGADDLFGGLGNDTLMGGIGDDDLSGGGDSDRLFGGKGLDTLSGEDGTDFLNGGADADIMIGGAGNDRYFVNIAGDQVFETTTTSSTADAGGIDSVQSSVSFSLNLNAGVRFVERLTLTGNSDFTATGNALANVIIGNSGSNLINGLGGRDILTGGAGQDGFTFNTALGNTNVDRIEDFSVADDVIRLSDTVFTQLSSGELDVSEFSINSGGLATTQTQRILYDTETGRLYYDIDGVNGVARVQFATLTAGLALTNADFFVF